MNQSNFTASHLCPTACLLLMLVAVLAGCQQAQRDATQDQLDQLDAKVVALGTTLDQSRSELSDLSATRSGEQIELHSQLDQLAQDISGLPESLRELCSRPVDTLAQCDQAARVKRVVVSADKMLVGELEHVWIGPPGVSVVARMDTGATSSSLNADNIVEFERDGEDWIRFDMMVNDNDFVSLERQVVRYARVIQQADPGGSRRPVVEMRVQLGDVQDVFEFTLADRSHLENEMILGRNFLADVTLVDAGKQFIQPRHEPQQ